MVGATEEELTDCSEPYVSGIARWSELARGLMTGDEDGMLKLLVSPEDNRVLGVHVIGTGATELVHIGQAVMAQGAGGLDFLVTAVFNYPTFAESYKVAALDAANRIRGMSPAVEPPGHRRTSVSVVHDGKSPTFGHADSSRRADVDQIGDHADVAAVVGEPRDAMHARRGGDGQLDGSAARLAARAGDGGGEAVPSRATSASIGSGSNVDSIAPSRRARRARSHRRARPGGRGGVQRGTPR